ncbi:MAG: Lipopolysaccharide export system ATP-binding protein LptB [Legionellaceae bacterium]
MYASLQVKHLAKTYSGRKIVKDVSLQVGKGEIVGLLGPNGAGKTTSFYMIVGLIPIDNGTVILNNQNITHLTIDQRAKIGLGYLPQEASIFRKLTVAQNIMAILELRKKLSTEEKKHKLDELLHEFHISHLRDSMGISLSGGERRRVEIARLLANEPMFILLDEPFAGVDPISVIDIKRIIKHLREKGIGILITDHNVRETLNICERAYIVNDGEIICEDEPQAILNNQQVRKVYLGEDFSL